MAVRPMRLLSLGCALSLPLCRGALNDAVASVQTVVQAHESEPGLVSEVMDALASAAKEAAAGEKDLALAASSSSSTEHGTALGLASEGDDPSSEDKPIVHGVSFERKLMAIEPGANGEIQFDHGCSTMDEYGGNICSYPHGSKVRVTIRYRVPKPIEQGALYFIADVQAQGMAGLLQNFKVGARQSLVAHLQPIQVECVLCGGTCEADILGKMHTFKMPACPIPAETDITVFDEDVQLPGGGFLALVKGRMDGTLSIKRVEDMEEQTVFQLKTIAKTGRIEAPSD
mmetsp:Transcript_52062/g.161298  ORF Transcript_52062/g.161298 Transcript_52062/m.161298 type:complete len:286 (-) Transcript_52062:121-978(-)